MYRITDKFGDYETVFEGDTVDGVIALRTAANKIDKVDLYTPVALRYNPLFPERIEFYTNSTAGLESIVSKALGKPIKG